jgi:GTP-binding protein HflX
LVWNKIDQWKNPELPKRIGEEQYVAETPISAQNNIGIDKLLAAIEDVLNSFLRKTKLSIPYQRGDLVSQLFELATVEGQEHTEDGVVLTVQLPPSLQERLKKFQINCWDKDNV